MEFSSQEYWGEKKKEYLGGYPFTSPGDLSNPEVKPRSPTLQILYHLSQLSGQRLTGHQGAVGVGPNSQSSMTARERAGTFGTEQRTRS